MRERSVRNVEDARDGIRQSPKPPHRPPAPAGLSVVALQRSAGNAVVARLLAAAAHTDETTEDATLGGRADAVQRVAINADAPPHPTAAGIIAKELKVKAGEIPTKFVGKQGMKDVPRPRSASETITVETLKSDGGGDKASATTGSDAGAGPKPSVPGKKENKGDTNKEKVNGMARSEHYLLTGAAPRKAYDAGHLIGDLLIAGRVGDSAQIENLAPVDSEMNSGRLEMAEMWVHYKVKKLQARTDETRAKLAKMKVTTTLDYSEQTYSVPEGAIRERLELGGDTGSTRAISFPRRIPRTWTVQVERPVTQKPKPEAGKKTANELPPPDDPLAQAALVRTAKTVVDKLKTRTYTGRQPVPVEPGREQIAAAVEAKFPGKGARIAMPGEVILPARELESLFAAMHRFGEAQGGPPEAWHELRELLTRAASATPENQKQHLAGATALLDSMTPWKVSLPPGSPDLGLDEDEDEAMGAESLEVSLHQSPPVRTPPAGGESGSNKRSIEIDESSSERPTARPRVGAPATQHNPPASPPK